MTNAKRTQHGELLTLSGRTLLGWATPINANAPTWIEILGDGEFLQAVRADFDLGNQFESLTEQQRKRGFFATLNINQWLKTERLEARLANTDKYLSGTVFPHSEQSKSESILGQVENHGGLKLWGWAWNSAYPNETQEIIFSHQGADLACIKAEDYRTDLAEQGIGNGFHAFEWTLPLSFADGQPHQINVFDKQGNVLAGSPLQVFVPERGIAHWVNQFEISNNDKWLLDSLVGRYQRYVPLSLGFDAYQEWFIRFGQSPELPLLNQKILIVIDGTGDLDATLKSLYRQNHINWIALVRGRMTDLLYHDDVRVQSVAESQWRKVLQQQFINCDIISVIIAGDYLADNALTTGIHAFVEAAVQIVYSDTDMPDSQNGRMPWFKPDFDIDLFLHTNALQDLFMTRTTFLQDFNVDELSDTSGWFASLMTILGEPNRETVKHLPWVLSHRAEAKTIKAQSTHAVKWLAKHSSQVQLYQNQTDYTVTRMVWGMPEIQPSVTLIIPTRDRCELLRQCITSLKTTNYSNFDYIVVDNDSIENETLAYFDELKSEGVQIVKHSGAFNFSAMNNRAVELASNELIALINNDIVVLNPNWLDEMVRELLRPNVGVVGAKLLWENDFVQHAGVLLGQHGLAGHIGNDWHTNDAGYFGLNQRVRGVSAVTAACLLCRKEDYLAVGGLNENDLPVNFNDVDFCLRLGATGKRILWTPHVYLRHLESASRGKDLLPEQQARFEREKSYMRKNWTALFTHDPFYNYNLNLDRYSHAGLAIPPRHPVRP